MGARDILGVGPHLPGEFAHLILVDVRIRDTYEIQERRHFVRYLDTHARSPRTGSMVVSGRSP
ncbi:hypothetical protein [Nocardia mexicana]|uniref:hypothetical protein n=1 Tax=Nocardia mexicana TaxID=279262 RepID=UPI0011C06F36|nr:hypothetical protein [Nocardia mexicana]